MAQNLESLVLRHTHRLPDPAGSAGQGGVAARQFDAALTSVGFKLSDGMEVPEELGKFKFARQKSKLAGTIRGSFFVIKGVY